MVQILFVRATKPESSESDITHVRWYNPSTGAIGNSSVADMVKYFRDMKGTAYMCDGKVIVQVGLSGDDPPHIRAITMTAAKRNLLNLPRF